MVEESIKWKDFEMSVELHKFYVDFVVKLNLFYYAVTGAILSFHFSKGSPDVSILALLLPILLSLALGGFFLYSARLGMHLRSNIKNRASELELKVYPEGIVLVSLCSIFGATSLIVGFTLVGYLVFF